MGVLAVASPPSVHGTAPAAVARPTVGVVPTTGAVVAGLGFDDDRGCARAGQRAIQPGGRADTTTSRSTQHGGRRGIAASWLLIALLVVSVAVPWAVAGTP